MYILILMPHGKEGGLEGSSPDITLSVLECLPAKPQLGLVASQAMLLANRDAEFM